MRNLVVGAGISGVTIANLIATELDEKVVVIDKKCHISGNCYDYSDENGITIHKYGSHIFHTKFDKVWNYVTRFAEFNNYVHKVIGVIDGKETHIPFNLNTLYDVFPKDYAQKIETKLLNKFEINTKIPILEFQKQNDEDLKELAHYVYEKIFLNYTIKQWGISPKDIDNAVTARVPVYLSRDNSYFQDTYQGIPKGGYTKLVEKMLENENITVKLNTDFKDTDISEYDRIFYTGSIDEYFNYEYGKLPYRSVNFEFETYNREYYQSNSVVNYPNDHNYTRIHEYKYYLDEKSDKTVIAKEYSEDFVMGKNERFYPVIKDENIKLYNQYLQKAKELKNVYFLGRLGDYKYYDMDKAILRAMELFEGIK